MVRTLDAVFHGTHLSVYVGNVRRALFITTNCRQVSSAVLQYHDVWFVHKEAGCSLLVRLSTFKYFIGPLTKGGRPGGLLLPEKRRNVFNDTTTPFFIHIMSFETETALDGASSILSRQCLRYLHL